MSPPREYFRIMDGDALRVRRTLEGGRVIAFTVQGEAWLDGAWWPVVRYDGAHGRAHRDVLDWIGRTVDKAWLPAPLDRDYNAALTYAEQEIIAHWARYRAEFLARRPQP